MDQLRIQHQKALAQQKKKKYETLKQVTKLIFSISVFSFLFARPSWLPCLHSSDLHISTLPFHFFNHTIDKNCMFLLCNGLLVFLANYSGLLGSLSSTRRNYDPFKLYEYGSMMPEASEKPLEVAEKITEEREEDGRMVSTEERIISVAEDEDEEESGLFGQERVEFEEIIMAGEEEEEEEEEGSNGVLSTEELNRKFDEFIRRMKEEINIDAPTTLVVV